MNRAFRPDSGPVLVEAEVSGPTGKAVARMILDTGASSTMLNVKLLRSIGYDLDGVSEFVRMTTGSSVETVPRLMLNRLSALGRHSIGSRVLAYDLPPGAAVDGLLGLDFFRGSRLTIDFRAGQIDIA